MRRVETPEVQIRKQFKIVKIAIIMFMLIPIYIMACCIIGLLSDKAKMYNTIEVDAYVDNVNTSTLEFGDDDSLTTYYAIVDYSINGDDISQKYESRTLIQEGQNIKIHISPDDYGQIVYGMDAIDKMSSITTIIGCIIVIISLMISIKKLKRYVKTKMIQGDQPWY